MAVWNADNVVLTKRGSEILSKVQAGNGTITVSRIVTGAGYVSASQLYNQTAVTNIKQEMTVVSESHDENGSTLNLRITNDGVATQYLMYQIGIYVTHPDYTGEQLYVISQVSDISHPDLIPAASEGVVTFNYSLYMEHTNTSAVTVTVDPAGAVSMEDFITHTNKAMCIERNVEPIESTVVEIVNATDDNGKVVAPCTVSKAVAHGTQTMEAVLNEHTQSLQTLGTASQSHSTAISGLQTNVTTLQESVQELEQSSGNSFRVTLPANVTWLEADEYYYVNLTIEGMKSTYDVVVDYIRSGVTTTDNARAADFDAIVFDVKTANGSIQVRKYSNATATVDLPLLIKA